MMRKPIIPVIQKMRAIPRAAPTPNHPPMSSTQSPVVINGIVTYCANGPTRKVVNGLAADSML